MKYEEFKKIFEGINDVDEISEDKIGEIKKALNIEDKTPLAPPTPPTPQPNENDEKHLIQRLIDELKQSKKEPKKTEEVKDGEIFIS